MHTPRLRVAVLAVLVAIVGVLAPWSVSVARPAAGVQDVPAILTLREQAAVYNGWLKVRLEQIVPQLMREEGIDMWLVICRENNEDPVYSSLVPFNTRYASRLQVLVFFDRGGEAGV